MFGTQNFEIFLLAGIALNLIPGQDTLYILGRSLSQGRMAGVVSVLGVGSGCVVHVIAAATGLYSILALSPIAFTVICITGGFYLITLGFMTVVRGTAARPASGPEVIPAGKWEIYRQGFFTNLLNPKVALFFLAFLPQFIDPVSNPGWLPFLFLGGMFLVTGTVWCLLLALCASSFADALRSEPKIQRGFEWFTCLLFVGMGISVLIFRV
ncbi:MAG: LysE family translocator [Methanoregulaceae archaeon]